MRVLITGAGGTLGRVLAPIVADAGHEPVLLDVRPLETPYEFYQGDVRRLEDVQAAATGTQLIVHLAGILGIHATSAREFYDVNLTGTFNTWEAAVGAGVRGLVFSSTMSVYKPHDQPLRRDAFVELGERTPPAPRDIYGYTKAAGEEMCRYYGRRHGIPSVALRYGMFSPEPFFRYGIRLLYGGVDVHDVARAVMASIEALVAGSIQWDVGEWFAYNIESVVPFIERDGPQLLQNPLPVLDRYYPGAGELLRERGVERLAPIHEHYPVERAARVLGYRPECNFEQWLEELRARPEERAEKSPPWP